MSRVLAVAALVLGLSRVGWAETPSFDYDHGRGLDVAPSGVSLRDVTYVGASGKRNQAIVVAPSTSGPHPGVLFVHWYGDPFQTSNRTQFVPDALRLAARGVVCVLVDAMWSEPHWFETRRPADDFAASVQQVKELRRAADLLRLQDGVDPDRVAYVGHDFGAMYGAVAAAADSRVKALVYIAGTASFGDWFLLGRTLDEAGQRAVRDELAPLDPVRHVGSLVRTAVLFQFASKDVYVTRAAADALVAAAREPKTARFYDCGHEMNGKAMEDRTAWLLDVLGAAR